ncbi:MAG TPA: ABC transporter permease [Anaerolineales bacterium]
MSKAQPQSPEGPPKKDAGKIFLEELIGMRPHPGSRWRRILQSILVPALAIFTGLVLGALVILFTSPEFFAAFKVSLWEGLKTGWKVVSITYGALFVGAFGSPSAIFSALLSGETAAIREAFYPFLESLVASTPYIFGGLSVALGFRVGLFNIGGEGQLFLGAIFATYVGYSLTGLPVFLHMPIAFLAGALGGAVWGFIPGILKAKTGAHEVINTIMLNYVAFRLSEWLLNGPMQRPDSFNPVSPFIQESAKLPRFFAPPIRFHMGFFIALLVAWLVYWFLWKTKWGFSLRMVGSNPHAARYAGASVVMGTVMGMTLAGALAGLAGANEVLGLNYYLAMAFSSGYGFDSIAIALLGNTQPLGVVLSALLFGALRNGATLMQLKGGIPIDIVSIVQAMVLVFVAAPAIIRSVYRLRAPAPGEEAGLATSWGGD